MFLSKQAFRVIFLGGAEEARTPDPRLAKAVLSQLSYGPVMLAKAASLISISRIGSVATGWAGGKLGGFRRGIGAHDRFGVYSRGRVVEILTREVDGGA